MRYTGFGPTLACEKLWEQEKIKVSVETLRGWMMSAGLWERRRSREKHRQRRIRRAEKEGLSYEVGSGQLLESFYRLLLITRRRHRLVPQPRAWFRNLLECMGNKAQITLARKDGIPVAALFTLRQRSTVMYKYGCSDDVFHNLAAMPFLFWKLIEDSKQSGATTLDLGRSDLDQPGHRGLGRIHAPVRCRGLHHRQCLAGPARPALPLWPSTSTNM
jgi:hypothetical protein